MIESLSKSDCVNVARRALMVLAVAAFSGCHTSRDNDDQAAVQVIVDRITTLIAACPGRFDFLEPGRFEYSGDSDGCITNGVSSLRTGQLTGPYKKKLDPSSFRDADVTNCEMYSYGSPDGTGIVSARCGDQRIR